MDTRLRHVSIRRGTPCGLLEELQNIKNMQEMTED